MRSSEIHKSQFSDDLFAVSAILSLPPSGGGRLGWGRFCGLEKNEIRATHKATLSPALSRWAGEGAGYGRWGKVWKGIAADVRWLLLFELIKRGRLKFINPYFQTISLCSHPSNKTLQNCFFTPSMISFWR